MFYPEARAGDEEIRVAVSYMPKSKEIRFALLWFFSFFLFTSDDDNISITIYGAFFLNCH